MASHNVIWDPNQWIYVTQGKCSFDETDILYQMVIGEADGENFQHYQIVEYISKEYYENILNGTFELLVFPNADKKTMLFNENGEYICFVKGVTPNIGLLNEEQIEVLNSRNQVVRSLKKAEE